MKSTEQKKYYLAIERAGLWKTRCSPFRAQSPDMAIELRPVVIFVMDSEETRYGERTL